MRRRVIGAMMLVVAAAVGCKHGSPARAIAKAPTFDEGGQSKCATSTTSAEPLVVEWPSANRAKLEARLRGGLAVVAYRGCEMTLLDRCRVEGKYAYAGVTRKHDRVRIRNADDLYASLPAGAMKLEGKLHSAGELNVAMTIVGRYDAGTEVVARAQLEGDGCESATHVISAATVGAFDFFAGADADINASFGAFGAGAGGSSQSSKETLSRDGDVVACDKSSANDAVPPDGCGALLRLEVAPIAAVKPTKVPDPAAMIARTEKLSNGLTLVVHEDHSKPEVTVVVRYKTGSINDAPQPSGVAHMMEHLMFAATSARTNGPYFDAVQKLANKTWNGWTSENSLILFETVSTKDLETALAMEAERMANLPAGVTPSILAAQAGVVLKEIQSANNRPFGNVYGIARSEIFPANHPYRAAVMGDATAIAKISLDDVRSFHSGFFGPNGAIVVLSGDVTMETALPIVQKTLGALPVRLRPRPNPPTIAPVLTAAKRVYVAANVAFDRLYVQWITPGQFESGDAELDVLAAILASDGEGRLEKNLVAGYAARAVRVAQSSMTGASVFSIEVDAQSGHSLDELLAGIDAVLASLRETQVAQAEVERARASLLAQPVYKSGYDGRAGRATTIATYAHGTGNPSYRAHDIERYSKVMPETIRAVANAFLTNTKRLVVRVSQNASASPGGIVVAPPSAQTAVIIKK